MTSAAPSSRLPRVRASALVGRGWLNTGGRALTLADLRGKVVVLDFWTFCCVNCLHVLDELRALEAQFPDELVVVGVHSPKFVHEADADALAAAVQRYEVHHAVLDDPELVTWRAYTARAWPTLVVIDPEGYIVAQLAGEGHGPALAALVGELVAQPGARGTLRRGDGPSVPEPPVPGVLRFPAKAVALPGGTLLVADAGHHSLVELAGDGATLLRRIGSGERGWRDGPPDEARFAEPNGLALVPDELRGRLGYDVVVADTANHLLRGVRLADGRVSTVAGTGEQYVVGGPDNEPGSPEDESAPTLGWPRRHRLSSPWDVAWSPDLAGFVVAMAGNHTLWQFDDEEGSLRALAGTMTEGLLDGPPEQAWFAQPSGLAVGADGRVWVADAETSALRVLDPRAAARSGAGASSAPVRTALGQGLFDFGHRDGPAASALAQHPLGVAVAPDGSVLLADTYNGAVRRYDPVTDEVSTLADGLAEPSGLVVLPAAMGSDESAAVVLVVESAAHRLTRIPLPAGAAGALVDGGAQRTVRPITELAAGPVRLEVVFTPAPGQQHDDRFGPSTRLRLSATPPGLLAAGAGDDVPLTRDIVLVADVGEGVLHVSAQAASCDADPSVGHPACHLATQDWGIPVRLVAGAPTTLRLTLLG